VVDLGHHRFSEPSGDPGEEAVKGVIHLLGLQRELQDAAPPGWGRMEGRSDEVGERVESDGTRPSDP
jgi:hypothetical protein